MSWKWNSLAWQEQEFEIYTKRSIFGPFLPNLGKTGIFPQNLAHSHFHPYGLLTSCKVSEKNIKRFTSNDHLKNPAIWLVESFEPKNSRTRFFLDIRMVLSDLLQYGAHFRRFSAKTNDRILKYNQKGPFLDHFGPFLPNLGQTRVFPKNRALSLLSIHGPLTSCKISERTNDPIPRKCVTDVRTYVHTYGQTLIHRPLPQSRGSISKLMNFHWGKRGNK